MIELSRERRETTSTYHTQYTPLVQYKDTVYADVLEEINPERFLVGENTGAGDQGKPLLSLIGEREEEV